LPDNPAIHQLSGRDRVIGTHRLRVLAVQHPVRTLACRGTHRASWASGGPYGAAGTTPGVKVPVLEDLVADVQVEGD